MKLANYLRIGLELPPFSFYNSKRSNICKGLENSWVVKDKTYHSCIYIVVHVGLMVYIVKWVNSEPKLNVTRNLKLMGPSIFMFYHARWLI